MDQKLKNQFIEQLDRLDDTQREQVLDFARRLTQPAGTPGPELLHFVGLIDSAELKLMAKAIQEDCEKIEPNAW